MNPRPGSHSRKGKTWCIWTAKWLPVFTPSRVAVEGDCSRGGRRGASEQGGSSSGRAKTAAGAAAAKRAAAAVSGRAARALVADWRKIPLKEGNERRDAVAELYLRLARR